MVRKWSETVPEVWKRSGGPPSRPEVVDRPSHRSGSGRRHSRRSGSGREILPEVCKWAGGPPSRPEVVGKPSRRSRSGWETLPKVWN